MDRGVCDTVETPPGDSLSSVSVAAAAMVWTWVALLALLPALGLFAEIRLGGWCPVVALAAPVAIALAGGRRRRWIGAVALAVFFLAVAGSIGLAALFFDVSWDGQRYHQEAVLRFAGGWNPIRDGSLWDGNPQDRSPLWIDHYPQASWLAGEALYELSGAIEIAKATAPLVLVGSFLTALAAFLRLGFRPGWSALLAIATAANPVAIYQVLTFYVDGQMAGALGTLVTAGLAVVLVGDRRFLVPMVAAAAWGSNLKFTGPVFVVLAAAALLLSVRLRQRPLFPATSWAMGAGAIAAIAIGYHPYVTNLLQEGHPFHPVMGEHGVDVINNQAHWSFMERSSLGKFMWSHFAESESHADREPRLKVPFTFHADELRAFLCSDTRFAGFGPWFGGALLVVVGGVIVFARTRAWRWLTVVVVLLFSVLIVPEAWWARFVPQLWLVPVFVAAGLLAGAGRLPRFGFALLALLLGNALLVALVNVTAQVSWTRRIHAELAEMAEASVEEPIEVDFGLDRAVRRRLEEAGIRNVETKGVRCEPPRTMFSSGVKWCPAGTAGRAAPGPIDGE